MQHVRSSRNRWGLQARALILAGLAAFLAMPAVALVSAGSASALSGCDTSWKAPGTSGSYALKKNWTHGLPTNTTGACLPASAAPYTVSDVAAVSVQSLTIGDGATLHIESTTGGAASVVVGIGGVLSSGTIELVNTDPAPRTTTLAVDFGATLDNEGTIRVLPSSGSQAIIGNVFDGPNATLDVQSDATAPAIRNTGTVNVAGAATLVTGALRNDNAKTHTLSGGQYDVSGVWDVYNLDVAKLDAGVSLDGDGEIVNSNTNVNAFDGLTTITANGSLAVNGGVSLRTAALTNHGRVAIGSGSSIASFGPYTEAGVYTSLSENAQLFAMNGKPVTITTGSIVGAGAVEAPVVNQGGTVYPAPQLLFAAGYTQKKAGALNLRIGDPMGNGSIRVNGPAQLGGTLTVSAADGMPAQIGDTFDVVNADSIVGTFTHLVPTGLTAPLTLEASYLGGTASVAIVASYDDTDPSITYGGWSGQTNAGTGTSFRFACAANETASFTFTGSKIVWNTVHGSEMGNAQVLIDGVSKGTFDLYAATNAPVAETFGGLGAGAHTIVVKVLGTHGAQATNSCVVVDSFTVGTTVTEDTARAITWSGWTGVTAGTNGYRVASAAGSEIKFSGDMTGVEWVTRFGPDQGNARVYVDGNSAGTLDLYSPTAQGNAHVFVSTDTGFHTITIVVAGTKDASSTGTAVAFDGLVVHGPDTQVV